VKGLGLGSEKRKDELPCSSRVLDKGGGMFEGWGFGWVGGQDGKGHG
jgi:hypothetical protein